MNEAFAEPERVALGGVGFEQSMQDFMAQRGEAGLWRQLNVTAAGGASEGGCEASRVAEGGAARVDAEDGLGVEL